MRKGIVLALALVLALSLTVPAAAAGTGSPTAPETSDTTTAPLPEIVENGTEMTTDDAKIIVDPVAAEDTAELSAEAQETFASAQASLADAAPAGMKAQYFFYVTVHKQFEDGTTEKYDGPVSMTVKIANATKVVVKQFVDGKWVPLNVVMNDDGTVTIEGVVEGPIAIFTA